MKLFTTLLDKTSEGIYAWSPSEMRYLNKFSLFYKRALVRQSFLLTYIHDITIFCLIGDECIPTWTTFFEILNQKIADTSHRPVLLDLLERHGRQVLLPIEHSQSKALYESDLVPSVIDPGVTETNTPAEMERFLALRATNTNLLRLKGTLSEL